MTMKVLFTSHVEFMKVSSVEMTKMLYEFYYRKIVIYDAKYNAKPNKCILVKLINKHDHEQ